MLFGNLNRDTTISGFHPVAFILFKNFYFINRHNGGSVACQHLGPWTEGSSFKSARLIPATISCKE